MALQIADFWKLVSDSRLLAPAEIQHWIDAFGKIKGASTQGNAATLCEWLISEKAITRYHATILLAGRAGPFIYGNYKVLDRVGAGRLAGMFRAIHQPSGQPVGLTFLTGIATQDPHALALAQQQVQFARYATSPNLSKCFEMVDLGTFKFVAFESLTGETVEDRLAARGPFSPTDACQSARQVALALAKLHESGVPHTEVRPSNIWMTPKGTAKLLQLPLSHDPLMPWGPVDFGGLESQGRINIVADYLAPELAQPSQPPDAASDIYALGCSLYQMLTGRPPFAGGDWREKIVRHATEAIQPLSGANMPPQLGQVVAYMMAKDSSVRYRQASQVAEALAYFLEPSALEVAPEPAPASMPLYDAHLQQAAAMGQPHAAMAQPAVQTEHAFAPVGGPYAGTPVASGMHDPYAASPALAGPAAAALGNVMPRGIQPKKSNGTLLIAGGIAVVVALVAAIMFSRGGGKTPDPNPTIATHNPPVKPPKTTKGPETGTENPTTGGTDTPTKGTTDNLSKGTETGSGTPSGTKPPPLIPPTEVDDDGQTLWVTPGTGKPIELRYVAADTPLFMVLRPADLISHPYGERLWSALGPGGEWARNQVAAISGAKFNDIQQLIVALYENKAGAPQASLVVRLNKRFDRAQMVKAWGSPAETDYNGQKFFQGAAWSFYLPPSDNDLTIVIAEAERLKKIIDNGSKAPNIDIKLERMLLDSDVGRNFNLVFNPAYVTGDGKGSLFRGLFLALQSPVEEILGMNSRAGLVSAHLGNHFFWELRLTGDGADPQLMARALNERIAKGSKDIRKVISGTNINPWARMIIDELPEALGKMSDFTRFGVDNDQAVVRCLLPVNAGQHLFMGAELLLAHKAGPSTPDTTPVAGASEPVANKLKKKVSLIFARDTLEKSIQMMSDMVGVPMEIVGPDLQLEGITKNQSFGMDEKDTSAQDILMKIMQLANPDGKLIYVIKPKAPGGPDMIFITTRASAEKRKDKIPPELAAPKK